MNYDEYQLQAVRHGAGPALVIAGPGAGKTSVLTGRILHMTKELGIDEKSILVITFTKAAAREMEQRYEQMDGHSGVTFGTFHSVFFRILRNHTGCTVRDLMSESARRNLLEEVLSEAFPRFEADPETVAALLSEISALKNGLPYDEKAERAVDLPLLLKLYEKRKCEKGKLDYDDLLVRTLALLKQDPAVRAYWQQKYTWLLVDEFQDINRPQYEIVKLLAAPLNNLFAVGDDDQSIYSFRGADPELMLNFSRDFPGAVRISLGRNYRSARPVVENAGELIRHNKNRYPKNFRPVSVLAGDVRYESVKDSAAQTAAVSEVIQKALSDGTPAEKIAVLTRTAGSLDPFILTLSGRNIPFCTKENAPNLFTHFICRPVYACLNWLLGNHSRANFLRFMNCPVRFFRRSDLLTSEVSFDALKQQYAGTDRAWMTGKVDFLNYQLNFMRSMKTPYAMINYFRKAMEYDAYVKQLAADRGADEKQLLSVLDRLQASASGHRSIESWYESIALYTRALRTREEEKAPEGRVMLSTIHASKGLEYDLVFLPDLNEKILPHEKAFTQGDLEEERRILYVGMTRAAHSLYLYSVQSRYERPMEPSRFLKDFIL